MLRGRPGEIHTPSLPVGQAPHQLTLLSHTPAILQASPKMQTTSKEQQQQKPARRNAAPSNDTAYVVSKLSHSPLKAMDFWTGKHWNTRDSCFSSCKYWTCDLWEFCSKCAQTDVHRQGCKDKGEMFSQSKKNQKLTTKNRFIQLYTRASGHARMSGRLVPTAEIE
jgi:hypothetical protein